MSTLSRRLQIRAGHLAVPVVILLVCPFRADADSRDAGVFALRNQNPFLHIFGLPSFQSATLATTGKPEYNITLDLANHADARDDEVEEMVVDGETYFMTLSLRRRVKPGLELGIDLPLVRHTDGFLDNAIEGWHDTFGMSNTKRRGPSNQLNIFYASDGNTLHEVNSSTFGLGDVQLTAAIPFRQPDETNDLSVAVRSSLKLPTGDEDDLHGSGAADFSVGLYATDTHSLFNRDLTLSGFFGVLLLGDGDVIPDLQRNAVPFAGGGGAWQATENLFVTTQLYAQGSYFDSGLKELGGDSVQLAVGGNYRFPRRGLLLSFAVVEDIVANATTDFALHFSVRSVGGR